MKHRFNYLVILLLLTACSTTKTTPPTNQTIIQTSNWQLTASQSQLSFVTNKNKTHREEHSLQFKQGHISADNQLSIELDLTTIDTLIPIRDQRLRDILFEVESYPVATISSQLPDVVELMQTVTLPFTLDLHGHQMELYAQVIIQKIGPQMVVTNFEPVAVNGKDFGLDDAINKLTKIAGLQSIDYGVFTDFKLVFEK